MVVEEEKDEEPHGGRGGGGTRSPVVGGDVKEVRQGFFKIPVGFIAEVDVEEDAARLFPMEAGPTGGRGEGEDEE